MGDLFQKGSRFIRDKQKSSLSGLAVYARPGGTLSGTVFVTRGLTTVENEDENQVITTRRSIDFHFDATDLPAGMNNPEDGDTIVIDGDTYELENILGIGSWRYASAYKDRIRVHTRILANG